MKTIQTILVIVASIFLSGTIHANTAAAPNTKPQEQPQPPADTLTYTIYGMDCPGCEGGLEKQVNKIPSVQSSNANWMKQEIQVVLKPDSTLSMEELEQRVEKANFTLDTEK